MPNTKSAKKSLRVGIRRNGENRKIKLNIRQVLKKATGENLPEIFSTLDKAAKKNIMHKNKAARLKSRISLKLGAGDQKTEIKATKTTTVKKTAAKKTTAKKAVAKKKTVKKAGK